MFKNPNAALSAICGFRVWSICPAVAGSNFVLRASDFEENINFTYSTYFRPAILVGGLKSRSHFGGGIPIFDHSSFEGP
jgi:hypothetical protein